MSKNVRPYVSRGAEADDEQVLESSELKGIQNRVFYFSCSW